MSFSSTSRFGSRLSPLHIPVRRQSSGSISSAKSTSKEPCIQGPPLHPYYQTVSPSLQSKFGDLDEDGNYLIAEEAVLSPDTLNFVVDFGNDGAYLGVDIGLAGGDDIEGFLGPTTGGGRPKGLRTRWICIFAPHRQPNFVEAIGKRYGLSPRHITLLLSQPPDSVNTPHVLQHQSRLRRAGQKMAETFSAARKSMERVNIEDLTTPDEVELAALDADGISLASVNKESYSTPNLNTSYMSLVAKVWHWHAVEWGGRFLCVGYNSLHNLPSSLDSSSGKWSLRDNESNQSSKYSPGVLPSFTIDDAGGFEDGVSGSHADDQENLPEGRRLWTWLILCDDGTIISLHEPHSYRTGPSPLDYQGQIGIVRKNILTILRSLSRAPEALNRAAIEKAKGLGALDELPFRRQGLTDLTESEPSLLFYYLFDDWYSSWSLAIERRHPYKRKLRKLRTDLIQNPELEHVDSLLRLARQLATLKRMYETYQLIIDRILYRQENSLSMAKGGGKVIVVGDPEKLIRSSEGSVTPESTILGDPKILGVPLSSHAVARFERLRDRIKLYALAELQDCLDEKDGLVNMTFQLIAFKQTSAVEKMTRVAILFAGATILFLPLTLLTGFFSMEIEGMKDKWRPPHFWGASGVSILITICLLVVVVKYSAAIETVKLGTQKARAVGQAQGWWARKKKSS